MSTINKILLILLTLVVALGLGACGSPSQPQAPAQPKAGAPAPAPPAVNKFTANTEAQRPVTTKGYSVDLVTTPDGLVVQCMRYYDGGSSTSAIDCYWEGGHR